MSANSNTRVFITGGSGFIGKHIITALLAHNYEVFILTRNAKNISPQHNLPPQNIFVGDIARLRDYTSVIASCTVFIHNAGEKTDTSKMQQVNVDGVKSVLDELLKYPPIKFIHISSGGVYGIENHPQTNMTEESVCFPGNDYERTKLEAEKIITRTFNAIPAKYMILRPTNVFGEHDKTKKLLNFLRSLKQGRFYYLDKSALVNYVYIRHLTAVVIRLIEHDLFTNEIVNVNSICTIEEMVEKSKSFLGLEEKVGTLPYYLIYPIAKLMDHLPKKIQLINSLKYRELTNKKTYSTEKLKQILNLDEKKYFFEGLANLISFYQKSGLL